jgi:LmbE family N-acetylglucosaminyl deacetylase
MRRQSLLTVFAHPDDESIACGGLIARCAERGVRVTLVSVSRGEDGPQKEQLGIEGLREIRSRELQDACNVLGIEELVFLDYPDGCIPWVDSVELTGRLADVIRRVQPDVVVTFGEDGLYWHPDHVAVHERTTDAVAVLGDAAPPLYYVTMPQACVRSIVDEVGGAAVKPGVLGIEDADAFGALANPPTLVLDVGPWAARKLEALKCHHTQVDGTVFSVMSDDEAVRLLGIEHFHRAATGGSGKAFIEEWGIPCS